MEKVINIQTTEMGQEFFYIYEIKGVKWNNDETVIYDRELNEDAANKSLEFMLRVYNKLYRSGYIRKQIVWC